MSQIRGCLNYIWNEADVLGQGATGSVYKARHKKTGALCAVKTFNAQSRHRPLNVQMREFEVCRRLSHRNIVQLVAIEEESMQRNQVLVMELCRGGSLYTMLECPENAYGMEESEFLRILHDIASGMQHLRETGIVHRDIKPGNILCYVEEDGSTTYKLTDFGAARELDDEEQFVSLYGTEEYLYPDMYERAVLRRPTSAQFDARVDLWSVGVTLYQLATGHLPFRPFGGRENRDTMHDITTRKQSGVLSGVQLTAGGPIEWSRELPNTSAISLGLRKLVTPLLAGLMESNIELMWTFDKFFQTVNVIRAKRVVHVFNTATSTLLHAYMSHSDHMAKFQEELASQSDIPAKNQLLFHDNHRMSTIVQPQQNVSTYPVTSQSNPIMLYFCDRNNNNVEFSPVQPLGLPPIPQISSQANIEQDHAVAKACCALLFLMIRTTKDLHNRQKQLATAVAMFMHDLSMTVEHVWTFIDPFKQLVAGVGRRGRALAESQTLQLASLRLAAGQSNAMVEELDRLARELEDTLVQPETIQRLNDDVNEVYAYIDKYNDRVVVKKELNCPEIKELHCKDMDTCLKKLDQAVEQTQNNYRDFRRNKTLRQLHHNEAQIQKFEKQKMRVTCTRAMAVVEECHASLTRVVKKFQEWYRWTSKVRYRMSKIKTQVEDYTERQHALCEQLDKNEREFVAKVLQVQQKLNGDICLETPGQGQVSNDPSRDYVICDKGDALIPDKGSRGEIDLGLSSKQTIERPKSARSVSGTNSRTLVKQLNQHLQTLQQDADNVKDSLQENTELLKGIQSLCSMDRPT
nr:serine/threonine-protein kinase TBK1 [Arenicola marina]